MEWVETTAKSIDEAKELALDQLGVLEDDADFEVLEEPRAGLFGRQRGVARIRARIAPTEPPPKQERRRRNGRNRSRKNGGDSDQDTGTDDGPRGGDDRSSSKSGVDAGRRKDEQRNGRSGGRRGGGGTDRRAQRAEEDREMMPEQEQRDAGEEFLRGLLDAMGYEASLSSEMSEDGVLSFRISGERLGLLIGPGLNTLDAVQEVCRNSIQRQADGRGYGKVSVDVAGVRADRTASLEEFVRSEAQQVLDSGEDVVFEVMSRGDRKVVHDVIGEFDGLATESVGEDPRRRVVLKRT